MTPALVAATGGLAVVVGDSGDTSIALAGAFSFNFITADTIAEVQDTELFLSNNAAEAQDHVLNVDALTSSSIFAIAAGGAGSIASGGTSTGGGGGSTAVSVAGSVAVNAITGDTSSAVRYGSVTIDDGDAQVAG